MATFLIESGVADAILCVFSLRRSFSSLAPSRPRREVAMSDRAVALPLLLKRRSFVTLLIPFGDQSLRQLHLSAVSVRRKDVVLVFAVRTSVRPLSL